MGPPRWPLLLSVLLGAATRECCGAQPDLTKCVVAVATNATPSEQRAAQELSAWVGNITGQPPAVVSPEAAKGRAALAVGYDAALAVGLPASALAARGEEGFISTQRNGSLRDGSWALSGGSGAPRGALYAVYHFLEGIGVSFLAYDATTVPSLPIPAAAWAKAEGDLAGPPLEYRDNNQYVAAAHTDWRVRQRYNAASDAAHGGGVKYASPPGFVHTSYSILSNGTENNKPPPELFKQHPEWFWPRNRPDDYGQLCWLAPGLIEYMTDMVKGMLRRDPSAGIISVSQNDNQNYCTEGADGDAIKEDGSPSGPLLRAVNAIAAVIEAEFPAVSIDTLAYQYTRPAPKVTKPRHNVVVRLCSIECNFAKPLTDPSNAPFQKDIVGWSTISSPPPRLYIWDYITNFGNYVMPFPNWRVLAPNIRFFQQHGVRGIFEEGDYGGPGGDLVELKAYVIARAQWDPTRDGDALIREFLDGYFGPAAGDVADYMQAMLDSVEATGYYMHENFPVTAPYLTPNATITGAAAYQRALQRAGLSARQTASLDRSKMAVYYVLLLRWDEMHAWAQKNKRSWPVEPTKQAAFDEFARVYNATGVRQLNEGGHDLAWLHGQVFGS